MFPGLTDTLLTSSLSKHMQLQWLAMACCDLADSAQALNDPLLGPAEGGSKRAVEQSPQSCISEGPAGVLGEQQRAPMHMASHQQCDAEHSRQALHILGLLIHPRQWD